MSNSILHDLNPGRPRQSFTTTLIYSYIKMATHLVLTIYSIQYKRNPWFCRTDHCPGRKSIKLIPLMSHETGNSCVNDNRVHVIMAFLIHLRRRDLGWSEIVRLSHFVKYSIKLNYKMKLKIQLTKIFSDNFLCMWVWIWECMWLWVRIVNMWISIAYTYVRW